MRAKMQTIIEQVPADDPMKNISAIQTAAKILKRGGLVAIPTETVYGLGANALDSTAVRKIFLAKGRPQDNPLIVHISELSDLEKIAKNIPPLTYKLAESFWPGPLTMIMEKSEAVPYETTAGLDTVAVRLPAHKTIALLLKEAGIPIAAPSANSSGKPSSTLAAHVEADLAGKIDMIIDSGQSGIGLESTVVDLTVFPPCVLRPGSVTIEDLREIEPLFETADSDADNGKPKSPGVKYTHYSPSAKLIIVSGRDEDVVKKINELIAENSGKKKVGILTCDENAHNYDEKYAKILSLGQRGKMESIALELFRTLRMCDYLGIDLIYAEAYPATGLGASVMNRLTKASGHTTIHV